MEPERKGWSILLDLEPMAQPRPRLATRGRHAHAYEPPRATAWKRAAATLLRRDARILGVTKIATGPVHVVIHAYCASTKRTGPAHTDRRDVDNLAKSVLDAMTAAGLWTDDRQVTSLIVEKRWAQRGCLSIQWNAM